MKHLLSGALLIVAIAGCDRGPTPQSNGAQSPANPIASEPSLPKAPADPVVARFSIAGLADFVDPERVDSATPGQTYFNVRQSDFQTLTTEARSGNGLAQRTLGRVVGSVLPDHLDVKSKTLAQLCELADHQHFAAVEPCSESLLKDGTSTADFEHALHLIESSFGYGAYSNSLRYEQWNKNCGQPPKNVPCLRAFRTDEASLPWRVRYRNLATMDQDYERRFDSGNSAEAKLLHDERRNSDPVLARRWVEAAMHTIHSPKSYAGPGSKAIHDEARRVLHGIEASDPAFATYHLEEINCYEDEDACAVSSYQGLAAGSPFIASLGGFNWKVGDRGGTCRDEVVRWDAVNGRGAEIRDFSRLTDCLFSGNGISQDFRLGRKLARLSFASAMFAIGGDALARAYAVKAFGVPDLALAYFALTASGEDASQSGIYPAIGRNDLVAALPPQTVDQLQQRAHSWKEHVGLGSATEVIGALEYFGLTHINFTGFEGQGSSPGHSGSRQGTGFVVSALGHVITNEHVVHGCSDVRTVGDSAVLKVVAVDESNDLALLSGATGTVRFKIRSSGPELGEVATALGYPLGQMSNYQLNATTGSVTALAGPGGDSRYFQLSAPVQPGNSGGPVIDASGGVIGVVAATADARKVLERSGALPQNMNYAIQASVLTSFLHAHGVGAETSEERPSPLVDVINRSKAGVLVLTCTEGQDGGK